MKRIATKDLSGPALDFAVALAEGYVWAKNASRRYGDTSGYGVKKADKWPVGALCLVGPRKAVNLHPTERNWDGWLLPSGGEPLAPAAFYDVPKFSSSPEHGYPIIERANITIIRADDDYEVDSEGFTTNVRIPQWFAEADRWTGHSLCTSYEGECMDPTFMIAEDGGYYGTTALMAAMRAYVALKFGEFVDVPEELLL